MKKLIVGICVTIIIIVALVKLFRHNNFVEGSGVRTVRTDGLSGFSKIKVDGNFNVILVQDDQEKIKIEGDDNVINHVRYYIDEDVLKVEMDEIQINDFDLDITIHFKSIEELKSDLVGSLTSDGAIKLDYLKLSTKSVGNTTLNLKTEVLDAKTSSVGNVKLYGSTDELILENSSVGKLDCRNLLANHVKIDNSSVGSASIYADSTFNIVHSGVGNLKYFGNGVIINQKISAVGNISKGGKE